MKLVTPKAATRPSVRGLAAGAVVLIALAVAGCGSSGTSDSSSSSKPPTVVDFAWLRPAPAPRGWSSARLSSGATYAFPPGWRLIHGDRGTATAALFDAQRRFLGYLNLTPRQGADPI